MGGPISVAFQTKGNMRWEQVGATQGMVGLHKSKDGKDIYMECTVYMQIEMGEGLGNAATAAVKQRSKRGGEKETHLNLHLGP